MALVNGGSRREALCNRGTPAGGGGGGHWGGVRARGLPAGTGRAGVPPGGNPPPLETGRAAGGSEPRCRRHIVMLSRGPCGGQARREGGARTRSCWGGGLRRGNAGTSAFSAGLVCAPSSFWSRRAGRLGGPRPSTASEGRWVGCRPVSLAGRRAWPRPCGTPRGNRCRGPCPGRSGGGRRTCARRAGSRRSRRACSEVGASAPDR